MKKIFEIGMKDKNGVEIRLGDIVMAGMKDYKGNISGWSKEIVCFSPNDKEIVLTPYGKSIEFGEMPKDSNVIEIIN